MAPDAHIALTLNEANLILDYLGKRPYVEVANLVASIQNGRRVLVQPQEAPQEPEEVSEDEQ